MFNEMQMSSFLASCKLTLAVHFAVESEYLFGQAFNKMKGKMCVFMVVKVTLQKSKCGSCDL